ncbi:hypothetical protein CEXT_380591 [Caerostris extrusa]|uniref:Uncharacterized protein n=1 Tax=Caerostris extrusa TaxID=172846 RepID=A0AAV4N570_CAEEX|nr:hypothetical protein CEXT_380591 [Caerostris extrusa]
MFQRNKYRINRPLSIIKILLLLQYHRLLLDDNRCLFVPSQISRIITPEQDAIIKYSTKKPASFHDLAHPVIKSTTKIDILQIRMAIYHKRTKSKVAGLNASSNAKI